MACCCNKWGEAKWNTKIIFRIGFVAGRKSIVVLAWALVVAECLSANASVSIAVKTSSVTTPDFEKLSTW